MEELKKLLTDLNKKTDKILNLNTKIAKTLHLIPVTEREEKAIQIMRERNAQQAYKVTEERSDMKNEQQQDSFAHLIESFTNLTNQELYADVLADDVFPQ